MVCTGKVTHMQRLNPQAVAREELESYREFPPLTPRELDLLRHALRFCPVPNVLARLDADSKRYAYRRITQT